MASADTNVLLRWALDDLPDQSTKAARLLEGSDEVSIADAAIIEMAYVLEKVYKLERKLVAGYIRAVMGLGSAQCNRSLFSKVLPLYEDNGQLSMMDCYLSAYAEINGTAPLCTFDKQMATKLSAASMLV